MRNPAKSLAAQISALKPSLARLAFPTAVASLRAAARVPPRRTLKAHVNALLVEVRPTLARIPRPVVTLIGEVLVAVISIRAQRAVLRMTKDPLDQPFARRVPTVREARDRRLNAEMWAWMEANTDDPADDPADDKNTKNGK